MPLFPGSFSLSLLSPGAPQDADSTVLLRKQQKTALWRYCCDFARKSLRPKAPFKSKTFGRKWRKSEHLLRMQWMTAVARRVPLGKIERGHLDLKNALVSLLPPVSRMRDTSVTAGKLVYSLLICSICPTLPVSVRVPHQLYS